MSTEKKMRLKTVSIVHRRSIRREHDIFYHNMRRITPPPLSEKNVFSSVTLCFCFRFILFLVISLSVCFLYIRVYIPLFPFSSSLLREVPFIYLTLVGYVRLSRDRG